MNDRLRVGIVGLGFGATVHLPAFLETPGVEVTAVADSGSGNAQRVAHAFGILNAFGDWESLLKNNRIDALSVATPPVYQAEIVCAGLAAGKHVLCEKPFGLNLDDAIRMFKSAQESKRVNAVNFEYRMEPGILELKQHIASGAIGKVWRINVDWFTKGRSSPTSSWSWQHDADLGGGVLDNYGSHILDYLEWIGGSLIAKVFAKASVVRRYRQDNQGQQREVTAEDSCDLVCEFESGGVSNLSFSNSYPYTPGHRIEVYGDRGRLVYVHEAPFTPDKAQLCIETEAGGSLRLLQLQTDPPAAALDPRAFSFRRLAARFVAAISGSHILDLPDFQCGLRVRTILEAARRSLQCRKQVVVSGIRFLSCEDMGLRRVLPS